MYFSHFFEKKKKNLLLFGIPEPYQLVLELLTVPPWLFTVGTPEHLPRNVAFVLCTMTLPLSLSFTEYKRCDGAQLGRLTILRGDTLIYLSGATQGPLSFLLLLLFYLPPV